VSARLARIVREVGPLRLLTVGLGTRCVMVGARQQGRRRSGEGRAGGNARVRWVGWRRREGGVCILERARSDHEGRAYLAERETLALVLSAPPRR
jgi:hypothetical protein